MSKSTLSSVGRFSSQMLTYLGTQRTVKVVGTSPANTYKYSQGPVVFPNPGSTSQAMLGGGVIGSYSSDVYNTTRCYFLKRGASTMYADTMTGLVIDMSKILGISVQRLLEQVTADGRILFTADAYRAFNLLRDPGNQVAIVTSADNRYSLQSREIRS